VWRRRGDRRELPLILDSAQRERRVAVPRRRRVGDGHEAPGHILAQVGVGLLGGEGDQLLDGGQPLDRGTANAHVLVGPGQLGEHRAALRVVSDLGDGGGPDSRIGVLPLWLGSETIQERHGEPCN
jgi:hypothetical protein